MRMVSPLTASRTGWRAGSSGEGEAVATALPPRRVGASPTRVAVGTGRRAAVGAAGLAHRPAGRARAVGARPDVVAAEACMGGWVRRGGVKRKGSALC